MIISKKNFALFIILAFGLGYVVSALVVGCNSDSNQTGGDISKANRYSKVKSDTNLSILQDKLQNDSVYFCQTQEVSTFLFSRASGLASLTERSIEQCSGIEEFQDQVKALESLNIKADNTLLALDGVCDGLDRMSQGKAVPEYEQSYNNAIAGFLRIENQMKLGKSFVESVDAYLENNESDTLAALASEWAVYCFQDAAINQSESDIAYWNDKYNDLSNGESVNGLNPELLSGFYHLGDKFDAVNQLSFSSFMDMLQVLHFDYDNRHQTDTVIPGSTTIKRKFPPTAPW